MIENTLKIIIIFMFLSLIYRLKDREYFYNSRFKTNNWHLIDAYKIFIPVITINYIEYILFQYLNFYSHIPKYYRLLFSYTSVIFLFTLFYYVIKIRYDVKLNDFGINTKSFFRKALPLSITIILIFYLNQLSKGIVSINIISLYSASLILMIILQSAFEELLIRGVLWSAFSRKMNIIVAAFASSICWSLSHLHSTYTLLNHGVTVMLGLLLAWSYYKSRTIFVPIVLHSTINILFLLVKFKW